jgi:acetyl esterase/lipase
MAKLYRLLGNERLSILCVDYSVTPQNVYPDQLKEGVAIYKKLTEVDGCDRVIIFGDSCGCNLGIALMALSKHANKDFSEPIEPLKPAYGAILCSPWVNLQAEPAGSYVKQKDTDILSLEMLNYWGEFFCADETTRKSVWVSPVNSESSHWEGAVPADNTFVIWGEDEVMKDDCKKWAETAGVKHVYEEPESVHDCVLSGIKTPATAAIIEFCHDILHV